MLSTSNGWSKVSYAGKTGYISADYLVTASSGTAISPSNTAASVSISAKRQSVLNYAAQFLGVPYVYGGSTPSGFDCSGFTMYIYKQFGYSLPHSATSQWLSGMGTKIYSISELQPGDLVFFNDPSRNKGKACSHAGIYIGNGQFIHSSSGAGCVVISDLSSSYYLRNYVGAKRIAG